MPRDTSICEDEFLYITMDQDVHDPADSCSGHPVWSNGVATTHQAIVSAGEYWVYRDSINCAFITDTIDVTLIPCEELCDQVGDHSGLFASGDDDILIWHSIIDIDDGTGYYASGMRGVNDDTLLIAKFNLAGQLEWISAVVIPVFQGNSFGNLFYQAFFIDQEGMLVFGFAHQPTAHDRAILLKFNPKTRQVIWMRTYRPSLGIASIFSIVQDPEDENYFVSSTEGIFKVRKDDGELMPSGLEQGTFEFYKQLIIKDGYLYGCGYYSLPGELTFRLLMTRFSLDDEKEDWSFYSDTLYRVNASFQYNFPTMVVDDQYVYCIGNFESNQTEQHEIAKFTLEGEIIWWKAIVFAEAFKDNYDFHIIGQPLNLLLAGNSIIVCIDAYPHDRGDIILNLSTEGNLRWVYAYYATGHAGTSSEVLSDIAYNNGQLMYLSSMENIWIDSMDGPRLLVGRIDTLGGILNTCLYRRIPDLVIKDVAHPDYFQLALPVIVPITRTTIEYLPETYLSSLYEFPACRDRSNLYDYQTHAICPDQMIEGYTIPGVYADTFPSAQGCDSIRILTLIPGPAVQTSAKVTICAGDSYEGYDISGIYTDTLPASSGCDSIHTLYLTVTPCLPIVHYGLDDCTSFMSNGSHMDYSEFVPVYPNELACVTTAATILHREPASMQKHSCTPGLLGTEAMCISIDTSCTYNAGSSSSLVFEVEVTPSSDSIMALTGLTFFQKAPLSYNWIDGDTGPNDYPSRYGLRILRDDIEIYTASSEETSLEWSEESFSFIGDSLFVTAESARYRFEFLPYCPVGNGAEVKAWDIEDVQVYGACLPRQISDDKIAGQVYTVQHQPLKEASLYLRTQDPTASPLKATSDVEGQYSFSDLKGGGSYTLKGYDNKDHMKGVSTMDILRIQQHLLGKSLFTHQWQYVAGDVDRNERINALDMIELRKTILGMQTGFPGNTSWRFGVTPQQEDVSWLERFEEKAYIEQITGGIAAQDFIGIKVGDVNGDIQIRQRTESILGEDEMKTLKLRAIEAEDESTCVWQVSAGEPLSCMGLQMALDIPEVDEVSIQGVGMSIKGADYHWDGHQLRMSWTQDSPIDLPEGGILYRIEAIGPGCAGDVWPVPAFLNESISAEIYSGLLETNGLLLIPEVNEITSAKDENVQTIVVYPNPFKDELQVRWHHAWHDPVVIRLLEISGREWYMTKATAPQGGEGSVQIDSAVIGRMPPGLYLVEVRADSGRWIGKIVRM